MKITKPVNISLTREEQLEMLRKMYAIRFFEEVAGDLYKKGHTKGGIHTSIGQEAVAVGVSAHLKDQDYITSTHRGHGHHIAKGADLKRLMAEILGKETGYCAGRGGSMHVAAFDVGSLGAFPIVAAGAPSAVGAALSIQMLKKDAIVVSYFGEGALGQGTLHESFNMASIWRLPVVFVCENNRYAVSTASENMLSFRDLPKLASVFGVRGEEVNGQDVLEVYRVAGEQIARVRAGEGPCFIHALTYRFEGHYVGQPEVYRTREDVQQARQEMDPINLFSRYLSEKVGFEGAELEAIEAQARQAADGALKFAQESPDPPPEEWGRYVYA
jgi:pyruvate dehydrogenase E1 component alpha subunit